MFTVILVTLLSVAAAAPDFRIVGGTEAEAHSHPYMASLQRSGGGGWYHSCGAVLIDKDFVLTAAHCIDGAAASSIRIVLGEHELSVNTDDEQYRSISSVIPHGNWGPNDLGLPNDIGLLKLSSSASINTYVNTIEMANFGEDFIGETATIAGWGRLQGGGLSPDSLMEVTTTTQSKDGCKNRMPSNLRNQILDSHICFYSGFGSACNGDSGGPAIIKGTTNKLIGITSWGVNNCPTNYAVVYTRVSSFRTWISNNMV